MFKSGEGRCVVALIIVLVLVVLGIHSKIEDKDAYNPNASLGCNRTEAELPIEQCFTSYQG